MIALALAAALASGQARGVWPPPYTDAQAAAAAPVQSVNTLQGAIVLPTLVRETCSISPSTTTGAGSCSIPAYATPPMCFATIGSNASWVFSSPAVTATVDTITVTVSAAPKTLNIALGALTVWGPPPAGTVVSVACLG